MTTWCPEVTKGDQFWSKIDIRVQFPHMAHFEALDVEKIEWTLFFIYDHGNTKKCLTKGPKNDHRKKKVLFPIHIIYQSIALDELYKNIYNTHDLEWVSADFYLEKTQKIAEYNAQQC